MKWPEEEIHVDGQVVTLPHRFKAGIEVDTTFEELERAVIVIGFTKDSIMKVVVVFPVLCCLHKPSAAIGTALAFSGRLVTYTSLYIPCLCGR